MPKLIGPMHSDDARGKLANSIVFSGWKGIKTARSYVKPMQPNSEAQGDVRLILGGLGRAGKVVGRGEAGVSTPSLYLLDAILAAPAQQSWISQFIKFIRTGFMIDAVDYESEYTEYDGHAAQATFDSQAVTLGLTTFDVSYKGTTHSFVGGLQLYELAKYAMNVHGSTPGLFDRAPYTTALASWLAADVNDFVDDLDNIAI